MLINSLSLYAHNQVPTLRGIGELSSIAVQTLLFLKYACIVHKEVHSRALSAYGMADGQ